MLLRHLTHNDTAGAARIFKHMFGCFVKGESGGMWLRRAGQVAAMALSLTATLGVLATVSWAQEGAEGRAAEAMRRQAGTQMLVVVVLGLLATFVLLRYVSQRQARQRVEPRAEADEDLVARAMRELDEQERGARGGRE
jgi:uncharacterized membrane protein